MRSLILAAFMAVAFFFVAMVVMPEARGQSVSSPTAVTSNCVVRIKDISGNAIQGAFVPFQPAAVLDFNITPAGPKGASLWVDRLVLEVNGSCPIPRGWRVQDSRGITERKYFGSATTRSAQVILPVLSEIEVGRSETFRVYVDLQGFGAPGSWIDVELCLVIFSDGRGVQAAIGPKGQNNAIGHLVRAKSGTVVLEKSTNDLNHCLSVGQKNVVLGEWNLKIKDEPMQVNQIAYAINRSRGAMVIGAPLRLEIRTENSEWTTFILIDPRSINYRSVPEAFPALLKVTPGVNFKIRIVADIPDGVASGESYGATLDITSVLRCHTGDITDPCVPAVTCEPLVVSSSAF